MDASISNKPAASIFRIKESGDSRFIQNVTLIPNGVPSATS
jgi:hypothetical protein